MTPGNGGGATNDRELLGARHRLVEALRDKGIRDLAVLRAIEMTVATMAWSLSCVAIPATKDWSIFRRRIGKCLR